MVPATRRADSSAKTATTLATSFVRELISGQTNRLGQRWRTTCSVGPAGLGAILPSLPGKGR
jgi:hypothetical protein